MRSTLKPTLLAAAVAVLAFAGCVDSDNDKTDNSAATTTTTARETRGVHHDMAKHRRHHADPVAHAQKLADMVGLSADQRKQVEAIFKSDSSWDAKKKQIHALLTPEQATKLAAFKAKHHGHHGHHGKWKHSEKDIAAHVARKAAWLQDKLGLTDKQKADIEAALKNGKSWADRKAAINKVLTKDQADELERLHHDMKGRHHGRMHH